MGMYTELVLRCLIKTDAPNSVIRTLTAMTDGSHGIPDEHSSEFVGRMPWMFASASFYHHPESMSKFSQISDRQYGLIVRCDLKNYENEIERFISWLTPYIDAIEDEFLGYQRYEESDFPELLYHPNKWVQVEGKLG